MPEYFFHIRLDIAGRRRGGQQQQLQHNPQSERQSASTKARAKQADIFASPPRLSLKEDDNTAGSQWPTESNRGNNTTAYHSSRSSIKEDSSDLRQDWRGGNIVIQSIDMLSNKDKNTGDEDDYLTAGRGSNGRPTAATIASNMMASSPQHQLQEAVEQPTSLNKRFSTGAASASTRARFDPSDVHESELGWGVVRLFRDVRETAGLDEAYYSSNKSTRLHTPHPEQAAGATSQQDQLKEDDCTTLCILAVPSYFSVNRFLSWVGDKTREEVSHFRMIRTEDASRYMVLMRFRNSKTARQWRKDWNGTYFDDASPEMAQVVYVKSIELMPDEDSRAGASYPDLDRGSLTSSNARHLSPLPAPLGSKPPAPPTPSLVEMPTCPVCLDRMDESSGLLTILCQHVFHCSCLYKWRGTGCPVCRFTHSGLSGQQLNSVPYEDNASGPNECNICHSDANLWICLICGNIGCGRYDAAHAFLHWQQSGHAFSMDMTTQRIWDYEGDAYVHRIVQNKLDGKISEAPEAGSSVNDASENFYSDYVPREKSDAVGREYTALLTSQLESQRAYFEEKVSLAADKASKASASATEAAEVASQALAELQKLQAAHDDLVAQTVPTLEKERDRANKRADKAQEMARKFEKNWREEKTMAEGLHDRIKKLDEQLSTLRLENAKAKEDSVEQAELVRDLQLFISGQEKLKELGEEVVDGSVSLPLEEQKKGKKRGRKNKGKLAENDT